jgi:NAD(P)-dependent dehydrogenase (short-subunit alcohol dehydrogenase family)
MLVSGGGHHSRFGPLGAGLLNPRRTNLARQLALRAIRVNTIHPGSVDNEFQHRVEEAATGADRAAAAAIFDGMIPLGKHADPDEVARAMLFLASNDSSLMAGSALALDGGMPWLRLQVAGDLARPSRTVVSP